MLKVLIVEDETGIRTIIKKYLSKFDITCIEAENGKKGLEIFTQNKDGIDLILMDVMMPEMDGVSATKKTSPQRCLSWPCGPDRGKRIFCCHEETTGCTMLCEMCSLHVEKDLIIHGHLVNRGS